MICRRQRREERLGKQTSLDIGCNALVPQFVATGTTTMDSDYPCDVYTPHCDRNSFAESEYVTQKERQARYRLTRLGPYLNDELPSSIGSNHDVVVPQQSNCISQINESPERDAPCYGDSFDTTASKAKASLHPVLITSYSNNVPLAPASKTIVAQTNSISEQEMLLTTNRTAPYTYARVYMPNKCTDIDDDSDLIEQVADQNEHHSAFVSYRFSRQPVACENLSVGSGGVGGSVVTDTTSETSTVGDTIANSMALADDLDLPSPPNNFSTYQRWQVRGDRNIDKSWKRKERLNHRSSFRAFPNEETRKANDRHKAVSRSFTLNTGSHTAVAKAAGIDIDSLTKEDLLNLWKISEHELSARLARVTDENRKLRRQLSITASSSGSNKHI